MTETIIDEDGCYVILIREFISNERSKIIEGAVILSDPQKMPIKIHGIEKFQPRLITWMAIEPDMTYTYSGLTLQPISFSTPIDDLRIELQELLGCNFPACLINVYRDGNDSVGQHSDSESVMGFDPTIVSVSLGVHRTFKLTRKNDKKSIPIKLGMGDILIMAGATQRKWRHEIIKEPLIKERRISLTFRPYVKSN